ELNEALRFSDRQRFTAWVEGKTASFPDAYRKIKAVNVGLLSVGEQEAETLEVGKNECALGGV
ncbi:MAG: MBL fold metallo-hydrolase, partial [Gemmatimonadota bacterium]